MEMLQLFWPLFAVCAAFKILLIPAPHSTDFEVHRNWLAITYSLPINQWYVNDTSEWTLDYPPFFAYFEWGLSQVASKVDARMLKVQNLNYASTETKYFQRLSVVFTDIVYALGVWRTIRALGTARRNKQEPTLSWPMGELLLLANVGLIFVDNIHFQYNSFLFGLLLLSISCLLEDRPILSCFIFATLLNFKHIFLYVAPAFAVYLLKFYCMQRKEAFIVRFIILIIVGLVPFALSFGPFWQQLPQVLSRLFPFKRGLTHAYWAPNFWALYNSADVLLTTSFRLPRGTQASLTSGLVQEVHHNVLPQITPFMTFLLTILFLLPIIIKLVFYTQQSAAKLVFLRAVVLCSTTAFVFGWHVHEKAILMSIIPLCLLCLVDRGDAKYAFLLSLVGHYSLMPLLFHTDLLLLRYSLYLAYMALMYSQISRIHSVSPALYWWERIYIVGFLVLPIYEHVLSPILGYNIKLPFMPLLLTSLYCSIGVLYFYICYYLYTLGFSTIATATMLVKAKTYTKTKSNDAINAQQIRHVKQKAPYKLL